MQVRFMLGLAVLTGALTVIFGIMRPVVEENLYPEATQVLSQLGSRGSEVRRIQKRLQELGYYGGNIDGIFGGGTKQAVLGFQRDRGLTADGIVGTATLSALGLSQTVAHLGAGSAYSSQDVHLLANIISAEARGEPYHGQVAVGAVVLNRVEHPSFPDSISGVVYQPGAFTAITDGQINEAIADSARQAAMDALAGMDPSGGALYYYNPAKTSNKWIRSRPVITSIGAHLFCG